MSESKHTPGPWGISGSRLDIRANNHGAKFIASVYQPKTHELAPMNAEALANARLISTAPELLEALEELVEYCAAYVVEWDELGNQRMTTARAAITKAKGLPK